MSEKKARLFYLDFIRAIAVILILLTHYNAIFLYTNPQMMDKIVVTYRIANLYIGDFGVSLFFIISGAALMYVYQEKCNLFNFYRKRFSSIYPMFWITFTIFFMIAVIVFKQNYSMIGAKRFIFTVVGFDSYLVSVTPTFYTIGEWFLGAIIILYVLFPIFRWIVNTIPKCGIAIIMGTYILCLLFYSWKLPLSTIPFVRLPEFCFGMYYVKYIKKTNWWAGILGLLVMVSIP